MRRALFILPLVMVAIMAGFFAWSLQSGRDPASIGSALVGHPAPRLDAPGLRDGEAPLENILFRPGQPVLVNFFASWCAPCLVEHPLFMRLAEREGVTIIGIAWKNKPEEARAWLKRLGDPYRHAGVDIDGKLALDWGLSGVPETYLIDWRGTVRLHYRRAIGEQDMKAILQELRTVK